MFKCNVKQGHFLLGLLILLQRYPQAVQGVQCNRVIIPNSDATSSGPSFDNGDVLIVTCNSGFSNGYTDRMTSVCRHGEFTPPLIQCYVQCNRVIIPNSHGTSAGPSLDNHDIITVTCTIGFPSDSTNRITGICSHGDFIPPLIKCYDSTSSGPVLHNGNTITVTCDNGYSKEKSKEPKSLCDQGILPPAIPPCYAQCSRPVVPNSDWASSNPVLNHGDISDVKCNAGYTNGISTSNSSECNYGPEDSQPICFAQCPRPVIANSDATSPYPLLEHGEALTITCDTGYSNGQSRSMTTVCTDGIINPALRFCYAQCSLQVIPNSDSTSSSYVHHGEVIFVKCDEMYSSGQGQSTGTTCSHGIFSTSLPTCYAQCPRPVITNSDASSPYPLLDHGEALNVTCDTGYSNGQSRSMATVCTGGIINPALQFCYAQCSLQVIPNSDSTSSFSVHHGEVLIVTCNVGYSSGQRKSTSSVCTNGIFNPPLPSCYADCPSLKKPEHGEILSGSKTYSHREGTVFKCNDYYTRVGDKEIFCYDGVWDAVPPVCMAPCSRPVIPNSDAISPNPLVHHGIAITVMCNDGYTNSDAARTALTCLDGTLSPDVPTCIEKTMASEGVAVIILSVFATVISLVTLILVIRHIRISPKKSC